MPAAIERDFCAHVRADETRAGRDGGGVVDVGGGICWASDIDRLFIKTTAWQEV